MPPSPADQQPRLVVAAVLVDDLVAPSKLLAARRRNPAALAGRWEFPGGKVEPGEEPLTALRRELTEELGVTVGIGDELLNPEGGAWPISPAYEMRLWFARVRTDAPTSSGDHDELRWLTRDQLFDVAWLDPDLAMVAELQRQLATAPVSPP